MSRQLRIYFNFQWKNDYLTDLNILSPITNVQLIEQMKCNFYNFLPLSRCFQSNQKAIPPIGDRPSLFVAKRSRSPWFDHCSRGFVPREHSQSHRKGVNTPWKLASYFPVFAPNPRGSEKLSSILPLPSRGRQLFSSYFSSLRLFPTPSASVRERISRIFGRTPLDL